MSKKNWFLEHNKKNPIDLDGIEKVINKKVPPPPQQKFEENKKKSGEKEEKEIDWKKVMSIGERNVINFLDESYFVEPELV